VFLAFGVGQAGREALTASLALFLDDCGRAGIKQVQWTSPQ
jgi:hypothetical protein